MQDWARRSALPPATRVPVPQLGPRPVSLAVPLWHPARPTRPGGKSRGDTIWSISSACMQRETRSQVSCTRRGELIGYHHHRRPALLPGHPPHPHRARTPRRHPRDRISALSRSLLSPVMGCLPSASMGTIMAGGNLPHGYSSRPRSVVEQEPETGETYIRFSKSKAESLTQPCL